MGGDFRKMTQRNADIEIVRSYVLSSLATFPKTAPLAPYLTNISIGTFIETGMLNTQGTALASQIQQDRRLNATATPEFEGTQLFNDAYSALRNINKEYRTGDIDDLEIKWQESTKELANMKAQMSLGNEAQRLAMQRAYGQEVINNLKEFAASVKPGFWQTIFTLGFAEGGQFKFFGNQVDATAHRVNGKVVGLKIGDTVLNINEMGEFSPEFINAFVAAADKENRGPTSRQTSR